MASCCAVGFFLGGHFKYIMDRFGLFEDSLFFFLFFFGGGQWETSEITVMLLFKV